ncbi:hypothetical protein DVH26_19110 [Paenibacillus sp. H1-7]|uniref:hypothetical protein n=1 Tax=Paenibacillus sp. H1-7 TaxID=2282849 RepID=UPI001EF8D373|nr:hypothetical protein [Paenibacillus sp. H1-7]ULL16370.1 hypothetical protein DVH26_19110 [Paenibacillus sp. H1-7]
MAMFKCDCGKALSNSIVPNEIQLVIFTDLEWELIQENIQDGGDIFDVQPKYDVWQCSRVYVFSNKGLIMQYRIEKDYRKE